MNLFRISFMKYYLKFPFRSRFLTKLRDNNIEIFIWKYLCFPSVQSFKDYISTKWIYFEYCLYCIFLSHHMVQDFGTISRIILLRKIDMKMSEFLFCPIIYVVNVEINKFMRYISYIVFPEDIIWFEILGESRTNNIYCLFASYLCFDFVESFK